MILHGAYVHVGLPVRLRRICVSTAPGRAADQRDQGTLRGEFQELVVALAAPGDPDEAVVIHEGPVLGSGPLLALPLSSPALDEVALGVAYRHGGAVSQLLRNSSRAMQHADVVVRIDGEPGRGPEDPAYWGSWVRWDRPRRSIPPDP